MPTFECLELPPEAGHVLTFDVRKKYDDHTERWFWYVEDSNGIKWYADTEACVQINRSSNPENEVMSIFMMEPSRGYW